MIERDNLRSLVLAVVVCSRCGGELAKATTRSSGSRGVGQVRYHPARTELGWFCRRCRGARDADMGETLRMIREHWRGRLESVNPEVVREGALPPFRTTGAPGEVGVRDRPRMATLTIAATPRDPAQPSATLR